MTYGQLYTIANDLSRLSMGLKFLLRTRLDQFNKEYGVRVHTIDVTLKELQNDFCQKNEEGKYEADTDEQGRKKFKFETPEKETEYMKGVDELFKREFDA